MNLRMLTCRTFFPQTLKLGKCEMSQATWWRENVIPKVNPSSPLSLVLFPMTHSSVSSLHYSSENSLFQTLGYLGSATKLQALYKPQMPGLARKLGKWHPKTIRKYWNLPSLLHTQSVLVTVICEPISWGVNAMRLFKNVFSHMLTLKDCQWRKMLFEPIPIYQEGLTGSS